MESHLSRKYTLAELEPGWPENLSTSRIKSSPRMHGSLMMSLRRVSRNPENSRAYVHGDPVHMIDWKAYARTDELILREHRDEAAARVAIVLDQSQTLRWPARESLTENDLDSKIPQKFEIAARIALYLAHAHLTMGDIVTIGVLDPSGDVSRSWTPRSPADVLGMYEMCLRSGFVDGLESLMTISNWHPRACDTAWWLSDFLATEKLPDLWDQIRGLGVIHIFSHLESTSAWMDDATSYRDESRGRKIYLGSQLKIGDQWQEAIKSWRMKVKKRVTSLGGAYLAVDDLTNVGDFFHWLTTEATD